MTGSLNPRTMATTARAGVVIAAGLALGGLTAHLQATPASPSAATAAAADLSNGKAKPKVVTIVRKKHVPSDPIIVYRQVPAAPTTVSTGGTSGGTSWSSGGTGSSGGGSSYSGSSGSSSGGSGISRAPAPQPAPQGGGSSSTSSAS